jgi:cytoplasmic tRNA 2-thiolation protein 2
MAERIDEMEGLVKRKGMDFIGVRAEEVFDDALAERFGGTRRAGGLAVDLAHSGRSWPCNWYISPKLMVDLQFSRPSSSNPPDNLSKLQALLASLPAASRPALLSNVLNAILNLAARTLPNVSHMLIGETSTREAQRVISGAAAGRGWSVPLELQPALLLMNEDEKVFRLKPMKELAVKEVAIYCHLKGIRTTNERRWAGDRDVAKGKGKAPSLEMLTERMYTKRCNLAKSRTDSIDFIAGLSVTHPSTVSTIIKTGDKLVFPGEVTGEACPMCQLYISSPQLMGIIRTDI